MEIVGRGTVAAWMLSLGCTGTPDEPPDTGADDLPYADTVITDTVAAACAAEGAPLEYTVTSTVPELIDVVHTGYEYPACGIYTAFVDRPELRRLVIDYGRIGDTAEECPETCVWTFSYAIKVDPGEWTIELLNTREKRTVTVL